MNKPLQLYNSLCTISCYDLKRSMNKNVFNIIYFFKEFLPRTIERTPVGNPQGKFSKYSTVFGTHITHNFRQHFGIYRTKLSLGNIVSKF